MCPWHYPFNAPCRFPHAHIVAVEPSLESFRVLQLNTEYLYNITRVHAALWSHLK